MIYPDHTPAKVILVTPAVTGFKFQFTIFAASDHARATRDLVEFFRKTMEDAASGHTSWWPYHAFGDEEFIRAINETHEQIPEDTLLTTTIIDSNSSADDELQAVNHALRCNPELILINGLSGDRPCISPRLVFALHSTGEFIAGSLDAIDLENLFEQIVWTLQISEGDVDWLTGRGANPRYQIFFEGECASFRFTAWLADKWKSRLM